MQRPHTLCFLARTALVVSAVSQPGIAQSQNVGYVWSGVSMSFQSAGREQVSSGASITFEQKGNEQVSAGVDLSFQNSSDAVGRGVSIAFGSSVPPSGQITASYGKPGTSQPLLAASLNR